MSHRLIAAGLLMCFSMSAIAQQKPPEHPRLASAGKSAESAGDPRPVPPGRKVWDHPEEAGAWIAWETTCSPLEAPAQRVWEKQLQAIAAMVRARPVFEEIRGYYPMITGCAQRSGISSEPNTGSIALLLWPPVTVEHTAKGEPRVRRIWRYNGLGGLWISINSFEDLTHEWPVHDDKDGRFYEMPEASRDIKGFPLLGRILYITPANKPPLYVPITQERALRWIIDHLKGQTKADGSILESARRAYEEFIGPVGQARRAKTIEDAAASQKKPENQAQARRQAEAIDRRREKDLKDATTLKPGSPQDRTAQRLTQLEARLAAMTSEQRGMPAWYRREPGTERWPDYGEIVAADTPGARPLVVANAGYFDRTLPKTAMQLVRTSLLAECVEGDAGPAIKHVCQAVVEDMDWKDVQAMLK